MSFEGGAAKKAKDRRAADRVPVLVPATLQVQGRDYTARMVNLVTDGAMVESVAPVAVGSVVWLRCGTIRTEARVRWHEDGRIGMNFDQPLTDFQIREQLSRTKAIEARRQPKEPPISG